MAIGGMPAARPGIKFPAWQTKRARSALEDDRRSCSKHLPLLYNMNTMTQEKLAEILHALHHGLAALLGERLEAVYLYGSQARGDARIDSDIDVLIVIRGNFDYFEMIKRTSHLTAKLSLENDTVISSVFVKKEDFEKRQTPLLINVRRDGVLV
jgi:predicted nucleotidyltransferase